MQRSNRFWVGPPLLTNECISSNPTRGYRYACHRLRNN
jgi:hypothetical protein